MDERVTGYLDPKIEYSQGMTKTSIANLVSLGRSRTSIMISFPIHNVKRQLELLFGFKMQDGYRESAVASSYY